MRIKSGNMRFKESEGKGESEGNVGMCVGIDGMNEGREGKERNVGREGEKR